MAIARTGAVVVASGTGHTSTPSYTVGASSNLLIAAVTNSNSGGQITGITYGGTSMTIASVEDTTDATWCYLAYLLNPATGANNFAFSGPTSGSLTICAADYSGVSTTDGSAVTTFQASASITTNITIAAANEWVVACGIAGHLSNPFVNTTNMTVEAQDDGFLACALMDTNGTVASGTFGAVTTITGGSPRQAVAFQAFKAASSGTTVTQDAPIFLENLISLTKDVNVSLENQATQTYDIFAPVENLITAQKDNIIFGENLASQKGDENIFVENLLTARKDNNVTFENLSTAQQNINALAEFLSAQSKDNKINAEVLTSQMANNNLVAEILFGQNRIAPIPIENTGAIQVTSDSAIPLEFLMDFSASFNIYSETSLDIGVTAPLELETAFSLLNSRPIAFENLVGQFGTGFLPIEFVAPVGVSVNSLVVLEFGAGQIGEGRLWIEIVGVPVLHPSGAFSLKAPTWRYGITAPSWRYISVTPGTNMPAIASLPPLGTSQSQTMAIDFGLFLPPGVTLVGSPTANVTTTFGEDLAPNSRITVPPAIGTVPQNIGGTGLANTAVLWRMGECVPNVVYVVDISCMRSDGDVAEASTRFTCLPPS